MLTGRQTVLLEGKNAIIYGAGGAVGSAVAQAFAREGAHVFLAGRTSASLDPVAGRIVRNGGSADTCQVDALDEADVDAHLSAVAKVARHIDVSFNAIGIPQRGIQGIPLRELSLRTFAAPISAYTTTNFLTARAAARFMIRQASGVILTLTAVPARAAVPLAGGMAPAGAAVEALTRSLVAELGVFGVRAVCIRSHAIPGTPLHEEVMSMVASGAGVSREEFQSKMEAQTLMRRLPTLAELSELAVFLASDRASGMTASTTNLSVGAIAD